MVQAVEEIVTQDIPAALKLLKEMNDSVQQVSQLVDGMLARVRQGDLSTDKGLSFLEVKYHMLLSYLINLTYIVLRKCSGSTIECDPAIDRLIEIRTVLEKMRPVEHKLKYQIDKMVKTAVTGAANGQDPSQFRANPVNMMSKLEESESSDDSDAEQKSSAVQQKAAGVYVPPKIASVHYSGDESKAERQQKLLERAKKRALSSSVLQELKEEYLDTPTEISDMSTTKATLSRQQKEKEQYEEQYFTRLPKTKQDRIRERHMTTVGSLGSELTQFADLKALEGKAGSRKRKKGQKGKGKSKKGLKKRRIH